ncbi:MAG: DUF11 domain-containing protein, partial [Colwellia sp.]|nr:DUF11 domain-containing protein [Colwellia sp.]
MGINKSVNPSTVTPGDTITYTITFSNAGLDTATNVVITDIVPLTLTNVTPSSSGATLTPVGGQTYVWNVEDLSQNESGIITITGQISPALALGTLFTNTARITTSITDADMNNNSDSVGLTVTTTGNCYATPDDGSTVYQHSTAAAVRQAVANANANDTVKVAGYCAGVGGDTHSYGFKQVVDLNQDITLRGGYTNTNWLGASDPINNPTILDAQAGGRVVWIDGSASVTVENLSLTNGSVVSVANADGGGVSIGDTATVVISNSQIYSNTANEDGGGIFASGIGVTVAINNSQIYNNSNSSLYPKGGGVFNADAHMSLQNSAVYSNSTAWRGGGLYITGSSAEMTLTNTTVSSNTAADKGGGLFKEHAGTVTIVDSKVAYNTAVQGGGGIYIITGTMTVTNVAVYNNTADFGGGVVNDGVMSISNSSLYSNTGGNLGADSGGGIYNTGQLTLTNSEVFSNTAKQAGGIMNRDNGVLLLSGTIVQDNLANGGAARGGGIRNNRGGQLTITNSQIISNTALGEGGGIENQNFTGAAVMTVTNSIIAYNQSGSTGGGLWLADGTATIDNSCIVFNTDTAVSGLVITATGNWWGAADGPSGVGSGSGDSVGSGISYTPYLTSAPAGCPSFVADMGINKSVNPSTVTPG